jgi:hypothetical protein
MEVSGQVSVWAALPRGETAPSTHFDISPEPVWTLWNREQSPTPAVNRTPAVQPVNYLNPILRYI